MQAPVPTPIYRLIHVDNLPILLHRGGIHAPNKTPNDGLIYRTIHNVEIQQKRYLKKIPCSPGGVIHDYVPFYFGYLSPMMVQLKTGQVSGYDEGQEPLIYLVSHAQTIQKKESHLYSQMAMGLLLLPIGITILRISIELIGIWLINGTGQIISTISTGNDVNRPNL